MGYSLRDDVVHHLSALNDDFDTAFQGDTGRTGSNSARIGIDVSIEGKTRSSDRLMAQRDVEAFGRTVRCEWHSKIEPHRNRIHFCPVIDEQRRILVGIFANHLDT